MNLFSFWLFLHILGAIIGLGTLFCFAAIGIFASKNPGHLTFVSKLNEALGNRLVLPAILSLPVTGIAMIATLDIDLAKTKWLGAAIVLYIIGIGLGIGHQRPNGAKIVRLAETQDGAAGPPSAEILGLINRQKVVGMIITMLFLVVLFLMVVKPG
ncbi:MAG: DUF2269 family protein [Actinomycetota bacterium]